MDLVEKSLGLRVEKEKKGKRGKEEREAGKLVSYELNFLIFGSLNLILKQRWEREERRSSIFARILVVYIKIDKFNFRPFVTAKGSILATILSSNNSSGWEFCDGFDLGTISIVK